MPKENKNNDLDLGLKVGSHRENLLTQFKDSLLSRIETDEIQMSINKHVMEYLEHEISEEKEKFKSQLNEVNKDGK